MFTSRKALAGGLAMALVLSTGFSLPAMAQQHRGHGGGFHGGGGHSWHGGHRGGGGWGGGAAVGLGILGLALGAAAASQYYVPQCDYWGPPDWNGRQYTRQWLGQGPCR